MNLSEFIVEVKQNPNQISFQQTIEIIEENYHFSPTSFTNGEQKNEENTNNGSCKIFAFAKIHGLTKEETLALFGDYYRIEVLENPEGTDHGNIRNFIKYGWEGISFKKSPLEKKINSTLFLCTN
ncbi:MAG: type III effector [Flavobacteriaceae bacterium]|nr:MAG: type III effector [Flavobacteriaceae bacterium]